MDESGETELIVRELLNDMIDEIDVSPATQTLKTETEPVVLTKPLQSTTTTSRPSSMGAIAASSAPLFYNIKWIEFPNDESRKKRPIIMQNENGPCPLISICNVLFLRDDIKLPVDTEIVSNSKLLEILADSLFNHFLPLKSQQTSGFSNVEIILNDTLGVMAKLQHGLDVNVKFSSCSSFEYTPELDIFDMYMIDLYHGWIIDPEQKDFHAILADKSYNQIMELIIANDPDKITEKLLAENFLEISASQMTYYGLAALHSILKPGHLAILFRNNHFSTIYKSPADNQLYILVTDSGFLNHDQIIWESLENIDNDGRFFNSRFVEITSSSAGNSPAKVSNNLDDKADITSDYLLALSLQEEMYETEGNDNTSSQRQQESQEARRPPAAQSASQNRPPQPQLRPTTAQASSRHDPTRSQSRKEKKDKCLFM